MGLDTDVLKRAYLTPLRNPWASVRIFWPFIMLYGLGSQISTLTLSIPSTADAIANIIALVLVLSSFVFFVSGAICWHRWLVLDELPTSRAVGDASRWSDYLRRLLGITTTSAALALIGILLLGSSVAVANLMYAGESSSDYVFMFTGAILLAIDLAVAFALARVVLGLPLLAIEPTANVHLGLLGQTQRGWRVTLLAVTVPLTTLYSMAAFGLPKLTPDPSENPDDIIPLWVIALNSIEAMMLDLLLFYSALVFLSALSFWYAKHERARLLAATPA
jgi:hypothetical protein